MALGIEVRVGCGAAGVADERLHRALKRRIREPSAKNQTEQLNGHAEGDKHAGRLAAGVGSDVAVGRVSRI